MRTVKVIFKNGDSLTTRINGTIEDIENYYLGNFFNIGAGEDNMQEAIAIGFKTA